MPTSTKDQQPVKVLYITGWGRSGTTILDNVLGQIAGFCSIGELRYLWDHGLIENSRCGCGARIDACPFWNAVLDTAFGGRTHIDARAMTQLRDMVRTRDVPLMFTSWGERVLRKRLGNYPNMLAHVYNAIQTVFNCQVIVDSSKFPSHGYVLRMIPNIDVYVVHVVRDPRGVAYSWRKKKADKGQDAFMAQHSPLKSSLFWNTWNITGEALWRSTPQRYLRLHYEEFVQQPRQSVERILSLLGEARDTLPFVDDHTVTLGSNHTVWGNPSRFQQGTVALKHDEAWRRSMRPQDKALVTALT